MKRAGRAATIVTALLSVVTPVSFAADKNDPQSDSTPTVALTPQASTDEAPALEVPSVEVIEASIRNLDAGKFKTRQDATVLLIGAGYHALPAVTQAVESSSAEVRMRAFLILTKLSQSEDRDCAEQTVLRLQMLADSTNYRLAHRAEQALIGHRERQLWRERNAVVALSRMNAVLQPDRFGRVKSCNLALFKLPKGALEHLQVFAGLESLDLSGTQVPDAELLNLGPLANLRELQLINTPVSDAGLAHLKKLKKLTRLDLFATNVTDAGLDHLIDMPHLTSVRLCGTGVTEQGVAQLRKALPNTEVQW